MPGFREPDCGRFRITDDFWKFDPDVESRTRIVGIFLNSEAYLRMNTALSV